MTTENKNQGQKPATRKQRQHIRAMLDKDNISFELAQAMIEGTALIVTGDELKPDFARFLRMMHYTVAFGRVHPGLRSANEDLHQEAAISVFWKRCVGHRVIKEVDIAEAFDKVDVLLGDTLASALKGGVSATNGQLLEDIVNLSCNFADWEKSVPVATRDMNNNPKMQRFLNAHSSGFYLFWDQVNEGRTTMIYPIARTPNMVWYNLYALMFYLCYFTLIDDKENEKKLYKMLQLFREGNYPLGFDKDDMLVVLVKE